MVLQSVQHATCYPGYKDSIKEKGRNCFTVAFGRDSELDAFTLRFPQQFKGAFGHLLYHCFSVFVVG